MFLSDDIIMFLLYCAGNVTVRTLTQCWCDTKGDKLITNTLFILIVQNGVKIFEGTPLPVFSEEDVFRYLDMKYLEPHDRDWPS